MGLRDGGGLQRGEYRGGLNFRILSTLGTLGELTKKIGPLFLEAPSTIGSRGRRGCFSSATFVLVTIISLLSYLIRENSEMRGDEDQAGCCREIDYAL